jgi:hypothetical protein
VVAWEADDALDEVHVGIDGEVEDDDLSAMDGGWGKNSGALVEAESLLGDEEEVADEEGGLHGAGGDAEGLDDEGEDEAGDDDDVEERLDGREKPVVLMARMDADGALWSRGRRGGEVRLGC